jgi:polysaccharide biosynthesis protein PslJ
VIRIAALEPADRTLLVVAVIAAVAIGILAAATTPLVPAAAIGGVLVFAAICRWPLSGVGMFVAIVATLPFGVIPVSLAGAQLTLIDSVLIATFVAILARAIFGRRKLPLDASGIALIVFALIAIAAFLAASSVNPITPELVRRTGKLLASLLFFVMARAVLTTPERLAGLSRWLMVAGAVQGAIGTGLMAVSPLTQLTLLTRLQVIGYPTSDVLRYVPGPNDTYTTQLRAVGTSVDPNVFGGTLMLALTLIVVHWASPQPVLRKSLLVLLAVPTAAGVLLSLSRASWIGLAAGLLLIGILRYRRILVLGLLAALAVLASPPGQALIVRFLSGFSTADPATAFRLGEYTNALTLLVRYPLLGIGFGGSPDIDVTAGVSSVYLLVGEQTGVLGLAVYVLALGTTWLIGIRGVRRTADPRLQGICAAFLAALSGALVTGLLDHYFANEAFPHAVALFWLYAAALVSASRLGLGQAQPEGAAVPRAATFRANTAAV